MTDAATSLVNGALAHLGEDPIEAIDLDPAPSRLVKIRPHVEKAIARVLGKFGWLCALEYATLTPSALVPGNWRFAHAYVIPEGGLRFWEVSRVTGWERGVWENPDTQAQVPILRATEGGDLNVSYVKTRQADGLDRNVADAVEFELAARACRPIGGSVERAAELRKAADEAILSAMGADGQDSRADDVLVVDRVGWLRASAP